jgi:hypothetical protein
MTRAGLRRSVWKNTGDAMPLCKILVMSAAALSLSASAGLAASTQVNIVDPSKANRAAQVELGNRLAVQEVPPTSFYHGKAILGEDGTCVRIGGPPGGKALIVRQVRVNTYAFGTPPGGGANNTIYLYANGSCDGTGSVGSVTITGAGLTLVPFDPGVAIPMGYGFSAELVTTGILDAEVSIDGYVVPANVAPVVGQIIEQSGRQHR